jgi:hypothetical protein
MQMGKSVDTSHLAHTPPLGEAALLEALAGFSAARDAPSTSACAIAVK